MRRTRRLFGILAVVVIAGFFFLPFLQVTIPVSPSTGSLELSSIQVQQGSTNVFFCTTTTHAS